MKKTGLQDENNLGSGDFGKGFGTGLSSLSALQNYKTIFQRTVSGESIEMREEELGVEGRK